jgi:hypothetical protein
VKLAKRESKMAIWKNFLYWLRTPKIERARHAGEMAAFELIERDAPFSEIEARYNEACSCADFSDGADRAYDIAFMQTLTEYLLK